MRLKAQPLHAEDHRFRFQFGVIGMLFDRFIRIWNEPHKGIREPMRFGINEKRLVKNRTFNNCLVLVDDQLNWLRWLTIKNETAGQIAPLLVFGRNRIVGENDRAQAEERECKEELAKHRGLL